MGLTRTSVDVPSELGQDGNKWPAALAYARQENLRQ
jgi:hypothetical protein